MKHPDKQFYVAFGARLRRHRKARDMTQFDLAERLGLSRTSITNIEKGNQQVLLHQLPSFCSALGASVDDLLPNNREIDDSLAERLISQGVDKELHGFVRSIVGKQ